MKRFFIQLYALTTYKLVSDLDSLNWASIFISFLESTNNISQLSHKAQLTLVLDLQIWCQKGKYTAKQHVSSDNVLTSSIRWLHYLFGNFYLFVKTTNNVLNIKNNSFVNVSKSTTTILCYCYSTNAHKTTDLLKDLDVVA